MLEKFLRRNASNYKFKHLSTARIVQKHVTLPNRLFTNTLRTAHVEQNTWYYRMCALWKHNPLIRRYLRTENTEPTYWNQSGGTDDKYRWPKVNGSTWSAAAPKCFSLILELLKKLEIRDWATWCLVHLVSVDLQGCFARCSVQCTLSAAKVTLYVMWVGWNWPKHGHGTVLRNLQWTGIKYGVNMA